MNIYLQNDYKALLREQIWETPKLNLRRAAQAAGIQYTYLSRALNDHKSHLSEDNLFALCKVLKFFPDEVEYILMLRSLATTANAERRKYLQDKINRTQRTQQTSAPLQETDSRRLNREMEYLFDPNALIVLISLTIEEFSNSPMRLCAPLGLSATRMQTILRNLVDQEFIELNEDGRSIKQILQRQFHYGTDHPLMRVHQTLLRNLCANQLNRVEEEMKHSYMVTFSSNDEIFRLAKERFQVFIKDVETLVMKESKNPGFELKSTYQLCFDLFKWL